MWCECTNVIFTYGLFFKEMRIASFAKVGTKEWFPWHLESPMPCCGHCGFESLQWKCAWKRPGLRWIAFEGILRPPVWDGCATYTWKTALFNDVPSFEVKPFFLTTIHISENPRLRCKVDASTVRKPDIKAQAIPSYVGWGAGMEMWTFHLIGSILNILNLFFYYASLFGYGILWALNPWYLGIGLFEKKIRTLTLKSWPASCLLIPMRHPSSSQNVLHCKTRIWLDWRKRSCHSFSA